MKIVTIFANKLFAFQYSDRQQNELDRILNEWNDTLFLHQFVTANKKDIPSKSTESIVNQLSNNAEEIDDLLNELSKDDRTLKEFFRPLNNQEYKILDLSKQKGRKNYLRIYALKIDSNCYVITGGAIKFTHLMQDRPHTKNELNKIEKCRNYLIENNVIDVEAFYEFLTEEE